MDDKLNDVVTEYENVIGSSQGHLDDVTTADNKSSTNFIQMPESILKYKIYILIIMAIFLLLIVIKPHILYVEKDNNTKIFSIRKLFIYTIIISGLIITGVYVYKNPFNKL